MAALTSISTTSDDAISAVLNACDTYSRYDGLVDVRAVATVTALLGLPPLSRTATASADFENTGYLQAGEVLRLVQEASGGRAPEDGEGDEADEAEAASAEADTAALSRLSATQVAALKSIYGTFHLDERGTVSVKEVRSPAPRPQHPAHPLTTLPSSPPSSNACTGRCPTRTTPRGRPSSTPGPSSGGSTTSPSSSC
jgi:hypothetical protein